MLSRGWLNFTDGAAMTDEKEVLLAFAEGFQYCWVCFSAGPLEIHHLEGGAARKHIRENLCRLCSHCHHKLHNVSGEEGLSKGQVLNAKRLSDAFSYSPRSLAGLRHRVGLPYGCEPLPAWALVRRRRNGTPALEQMGEVMACNSRRKGKTGELEAAHALNEQLPSAHARRAQQYSGTESTADLLAPGLPNLYLEVKRRQSMNLHTVFDESEENCGSLAPVVIHRKDNTDWIVSFKLDDLRQVIEQLRGAM